MKVRPTNPDAIIRDPNTKIALPPEGGVVSDSNFWARRLASGEVVLVDEPPTPTGLEPTRPLTTRGSK